MISVSPLLAGVVIALALDSLWRMGVAIYHLVSSKQSSAAANTKDAPPRKPATSPHAFIDMEYLEWAMENPNDQDAMTYLMGALDAQGRQMAHMVRMMKIHDGLVLEEGSAAALDQQLHLSEFENQRREAESLVIRIEAALSKADTPQQ